MKSYLVKLSLLLINSLSFFYSHLPRGVRWFVAGCISWLWIHIFKIRLYTVCKNLRIVFPGLSISEYRSKIKNYLHWSVYYALEFLKVPTLSASELNKTIIIHGSEHFDSARSQGKGVYLLSLHLGCPDIALNALAIAGYPIWLISKKFSNEGANDLWFSLRSRSGLKYIEAHGKQTVFQIFKALGNNEAVIFVLDQFMGPPFGIQTPFFNKETGTAYGLSRFFIKNGSPLVPVYTYQDQKGVTHIQFDSPLTEEILDSLSHLSLEEKSAHLTTLFNKKIEAIILKHPEHWMWAHRRWKKWQIT